MIFRTLVFYLLPLACGTLLVFVGEYPSIPAIALLLTAYFVSTSLTVLVESNVQYSISSVSRATVTSVSALLINLFAVLLTPVFGLIAKTWNLQAIYLTVSLSMFVFAAWVFAVKKRVAVKAANG